MYTVMVVDVPNANQADLGNEISTMYNNGYAYVEAIYIGDLVAIVFGRDEEDSDAEDFPTAFIDALDDNA